MSKGEKNGYQCQNPDCGHLTVTLDVDDGVTPMFVQCPRCRTRAVSQWYWIDQSLPHEGEWFKPTEKQIRKASPAMREHFRLGGLDYRPVAMPENATQSDTSSGEGR